MDVAKIHSLLEQVSKSGTAPQRPDPTQAFSDLLHEASEQQKKAGAAAERFITSGEGELHQVQLQMAKADITFRFLLEVRNKLTEAYQEVSRMSV